MVIVKVVQLAIIMPFISVVSNAEYVIIELQYLLNCVSSVKTIRKFVIGDLKSSEKRKENLEGHEILLILMFAMFRVWSVFVVVLRKLAYIHLNACRFFWYNAGVN